MKFAISWQVSVNLPVQPLAWAGVGAAIDTAATTATRAVAARMRFVFTPVSLRPGFNCPRNLRAPSGSRKRVPAWVAARGQKFSRARRSFDRRGLRCHARRLLNVIGGAESRIPPTDLLDQ